MPLEIRADQWADVIKKRLAGDLEIAKGAAFELAQRGVTEAVEVTTALDKVDLGAFRLGWTVIRLDDRIRLENATPYAGIIEYGRRPNRPGPPYLPIFGWVKRKLVGRGQVAPEEAEHVAMLVQRAIHLRGTRPFYILAGVFENIKDRFRGAVVAAIKRKAAKARKAGAASKPKAPRAPNRSFSDLAESRASRFLRAEKVPKGGKGSRKVKKPKGQP